MISLALSFLKSYWPQLAAFVGAVTIGFGLAWNLQGLRLDALDIEFKQYQNEVEQKKAEANKAIAQAEGEKQVAIKQAEGIAESLRLRSEAEAKANDLIGASIARNPKLIEYNVAKKWNGETPKVTGSGGMIVQVPPVN